MSASDAVYNNTHLWHMQRSCVRCVGMAASTSHYLLRLRLLHPVTVVLGAIYVLWIVLKSSRRQAHSSKTLPFLISTLILQAGLGVMNVILLAPVWLQIVHLLVADLFWILLVFASADLLLEIRSCQSVVKPKRAIELKRILRVSRLILFRLLFASTGSRIPDVRPPLELAQLPFLQSFRTEFTRFRNTPHFLLLILN